MNRTEFLIYIEQHNHRPSTKYPSFEYMLVIDEGEPQSFQEAMQDEMDSLQKNENYELVQLPKGRKSLKKQMSVQVVDRYG